jgi:hypothetical protein
MKGKILRKGFDSVWDLLIRMGFTNTSLKIDLFDNKSFENFIQSLVPYSDTESLYERLQRCYQATDDDMIKLQWLGFFENDWPEGYKDLSPANILQYLLERKLSLQAHEKDCIVMRHVLEYTSKNYQHKFTATLIAQGEDEKNSALAKAIGLTTGAAAKAVLMGNIKGLKGIHTPVKPEIYDPILNELDDLGVAFHVEETSVHMEEVDKTNAAVTVDLK